MPLGHLHLRPDHRVIPTATGRTFSRGTKYRLRPDQPAGPETADLLPAPNQPGAEQLLRLGGPCLDRDYIDIKDELQPQRTALDLGQYGHMSALSAATASSASPGGPAPGSDPGLGDTHINNGSIGHTYTFSPTVLLDGVFGYQRMEQTRPGQRFRHQLRRPTRNSRVERARCPAEWFPERSDQRL